jgi:hypothetical protein
VDARDKPGHDGSHQRPSIADVIQRLNSGDSSNAIAARCTSGTSLVPCGAPISFQLDTAERWEIAEAA